MLRKVYLHGRLRQKFGALHELAIDTVGEAVRALSQHAGFLDEIKKGSYELIRGNKRDGLRLDLEDVNTFKLGKGELHIVPVTRGAKNSGGTLKIVLGVALLGAAIFFSGGTAAGLAAPIAGNALGFSYGNLAMMGLGMALAGVAQLLTPSQTTKDKQDQSFALGPSNTSAQGVPVPYVFGDVMTGSVLVSAGMDVEPIPVGWDPLKGNTTPYGGDPI